jgi:hypothetical protein
MPTSKMTNTIDWLMMFREIISLYIAIPCGLLYKVLYTVNPTKFVEKVVGLTIYKMNLFCVAQ